MERLYVTLREQTETVQDADGNYLKDAVGNFVRKQLTPLGYGARYNPGKDTVDNKNAKQRDWAYNQYHYKNCSVEGNVVMVTKGEWKRDANGKSTWVEEPAAPATLQPLILDNVAIEGFKITDFATRYSTSNKLIRILDPRGFELEISVANLLELLDHCTVTNSVFIGKYKWDFGKNGIGKAKLVKG